MALLSTWTTALAIAECFNLALAQRSAYVPQAHVVSKVGFSTSFSCESQGIPITTCLWEREPPAGSTTGTFILNIHPGNAREGKSIQPGYSYVGTGLGKGECGLTIKTFKEEDSGKWMCVLITNSGLYRGKVDLGILRKPDQPKFNLSVLSQLVDSDDSRFRTTHPARIVCFSGNGKPPPRFQWFIDDEAIHEGLTSINSTVDTGSGIQYTFQELVNHRFTWRDNGKKLRCVAIHDALGPNDQKEAQLDINIQFAPRPSREDVGSHVNVRADIGTEKILSVKVAANPRPTQVVWTVDKRQIREGENTEKYDAMIIKEVEPGVWQTNLRIRAVEEEDVNKHFLLKVTNSFGEADFDLKVSVFIGVLSAVGIVLLILGIAALLIIIALVVVYARAQGLLCFKARCVGNELDDQGGRRRRCVSSSK